MWSIFTAATVIPIKRNNTIQYMPYTVYQFSYTQYTVFSLKKRTKLCTVQTQLTHNTIFRTLQYFYVDKRIFYQREKSPVDVLSGTKTRISCENKSATSS